jgi:hypothetical protein
MTDTRIGMAKFRASGIQNARQHPSAGVALAIDEVRRWLHTGGLVSRN